MDNTKAVIKVNGQAVTKPATSKKRTTVSKAVVKPDKDNTTSFYRGIDTKYLDKADCLKVTSKGKTRMHLQNVSYTADGNGIYLPDSNTGNNLVKRFANKQTVAVLAVILFKAIDNNDLNNFILPVPQKANKVDRAIMQFMALCGTCGYVVGSGTDGTTKDGLQYNKIYVNHANKGLAGNGHKWAIKNKADIKSLDLDVVAKLCVQFLSICTGQNKKAVMDRLQQSKDDDIKMLLSHAKAS